MTTEPNTLKPCPFCGDEAELREGNIGEHIECTRCGAKTRHSLYRETNTPTKRWNTRTPGPALIEVMRKVKEALESCGDQRGYDGGLYQIYDNVLVEQALSLLEPYLGEQK